MRTSTKIGARIGTAALAGFLVALAGCGGGPDSAGAGSVATSGRSSSASTFTLARHTYVSTSVTGRTLAGGTVISLTFDGDDLTANAGCNTLIGTYGTDGGRLDVGEMRIDKPIPCPSVVSEETSWLSGFLSGRPTLTLDRDQLTLISGSTTIELTERGR